MKNSVDNPEIKQWLEIRKAEGPKIDPETAEVDWNYAYVVDPYGLDQNLPDEYKCVGRAYFARSPGSEIWVSFDDLPEATAKRLWERHSRKLRFPAGLEGLSDGPAR